MQESSVKGMLWLALAVAVTGTIGYFVSGSLRAGQEMKLAEAQAGVNALPKVVAPTFSLTDERGSQVRLGQFLGKSVVLLFVDPNCHSTCSIMSDAVALADQKTSQLAKTTVFLAINVDPSRGARSDLQTFDRAHGLAGLTNWYFLTGPATDLADVWKSYDIYVGTPKNGQVTHADYIYVIDPKGAERWIFQGSTDGSLANAYASILTSYAASASQGSAGSGP